MKCEEPFGDKWEVDHIVPQSIWPEGKSGLHDIESNLQIMCSECNNHKKNKETIDYRIKIDVIYFTQEVDTND